jgi:hypothetical protein
MRFAPKPSRLSPLPPPPSSHRIGVSRVDSPLGGGAPTNTVATGEVHGAGAPPEGALIAVEVRLNLPYVTGLLWNDSTAIGEQNEVPELPRSRRKNRIKE